MISRALVAIIVAASPVALWSSDQATAKNLLEAASKQAAIWDSSDRPFLIDVDFTVVQSTAPVQGHLRVRYQAKDLWWRRASIAKFEEVKFQKGEQTYELRNADATPKLLWELLKLLHAGVGYEKLLAEGDKQRFENGYSIDCVKAHDPNFTKAHIEICIDTSTHDIVSETRKVAGYSRDFVERLQFADFAEFQGHRFPRRLDSTKDGHPQISATVTDLKESSIDPKLFEPPPGALERTECANMTRPQEIDHPIPELHLGPGETIQIDAEVTVLTDGSVGKVAVAGSSGGQQAGTLVNSLRRWKFRPAMCGSRPVVSDVYESFEFDNAMRR